MVDLSGNGVRVRCKGGAKVSVGKVVPLTLKSDQCHVTLKSRVVRVNRTGFRNAEIGLAFVEVRPGLRAALQNLAKYGFIPRLVSSSDGHHSTGPRHKSAIPDYYGLLRLAPSATQEQIRAAYHVAAKRYHPDAARTPDQVVMFQAVSEAYQILHDPVKRREYDARRAAAA